MRSEHIATHTAALSAFSSSFHWRTIFGKIKVLRRSICSSAILNTLRLKHFPLADIPDSINSEWSATQVRRLNPQSHFCRTYLNWIRHGRNATYEPGLSSLCKRLHCVVNKMYVRLSGMQLCKDNQQASVSSLALGKNNIGKEPVKQTKAQIQILACTAGKSHLCFSKPFFVWLFVCFVFTACKLLLNDLLFQLANNLSQPIKLLSWLTIIFQVFGTGNHPKGSRVTSLHDFLSFTFTPYFIA